MRTPVNISNRFRIIVDTFLNIETDFIKACAKILGDNGLMELWATDRHKAERMLRAELQAAAAGEWDGGAKKELAKVLEDIAGRSIYEDEAIYKRAKKAGFLKGRTPPPIGQGGPTQKLLENCFKSLSDVLNKTIFTATDDTIARLRRATVGVADGSITLDKGIRQAINDFAKKGISGITYKESGLNMEMISYIRREITTQTFNMTREMGFARAKEWDADDIQVSAHAGARPRCFPYQGGIYSISGKSSRTPLKDTSYGEPAGLFGINCSHYFWPFFEGFNDEYTAEERDPARYGLGVDNKEAYERSQEQRAHERRIRKAKRKAAELEAAGVDHKSAYARVKEAQKDMRKFISDNANLDLRRDYLREKLA
jgi:hypothetical protein